MGPTQDPWLISGIHEYVLRLQHYVDFFVCEIPVPRKASAMPEKARMEAEAKLLMKYLEGFDRVVLLDEKGEMMTSVAFASFIEKAMNTGTKKLAFVVGGPYGFADSILSRGYTRLSLSRMTLPHQMVRLFFTEQLYRAFTILKGERYHHG